MGLIAFEFSFNQICWSKFEFEVGLISIILSSDSDIKNDQRNSGAKLRQKEIFGIYLFAPWRGALLKMWCSTCFLNMVHSQNFMFTKPALHVFLFFFLQLDSLDSFASFKKEWAFFDQNRTYKGRVQKNKRPFFVVFDYEVVPFLCR